ncbi:hypothetical protein [Legionella impletisoli]|uniref:Transmembrane protein n=1 Tax=Legionella impletisoli TaxID=343510 RepID=A0A917N7K9_9GAMM|nr:hypothetical protein [Legionella impletisoli]GGI75289.1 hypothetical protein GCM10007966_00110 [Legionella impletisoli]
MNKKAIFLDKISGNLFLGGLFLSKLRYIPVLAIRPILDLMSLLAYLVGYIAWYAATIFYPNHPRKRDRWYGFTEFKEQYQLASLVGLFSTILCLINPALILVSVWLFTLSNMIWAISEYHRFKHPPAYEEGFSYERQAMYLRYTMAALVVSLITAVATTVAVLFPPAAIATLVLSALYGNALTLLAFYYWKQCTFTKFEPDVLPKASYSGISARIGGQSERALECLIEETESNRSDPLWKSAPQTSISGPDLSLEPPELKF